VIDDGVCASTVTGTNNPGTCAAPSCKDKVLNGNETDTDCGGGSCPACANTRTCKVGMDCLSGVCTGEMAVIRDRLEAFLTFDTEVLAVSCDPVYALRAFADSDGLNFPLLSDFWPHGEVTRAYAVFDEARGCPFRSSYILDKEGVVRWAVHNEGSQERDLGEHLAQLEALA